MVEVTSLESSKPMELRWVESKEVISSEGRSIGTLSGALLNLSNWTVSSLLIELNKTVLEELKVKKPLLHLAKVTIPTSVIKNFSDVVQLNTDIATLGAVIAANKS